MLTKKQLLKECTALANSPLSVLEIERLEIAAVEAIRLQAPKDLEFARVILRATAEIRKARGLWDHVEMTDREIDDELAMVRGQS